MLYKSAEMFMAAPNKRVTLMGMSNVGKTTLAKILPQDNWFHYSIDYRLATSHLRDSIVDVLKMEMMKNDYLAKHLREDAVGIDLNVSLSNLSMISHFLGKLGDPSLGGLNELEFRRRQLLHRKAEIAATTDLGEFIQRAVDIYSYDHFINDASGSLCEIIDVDNADDPVLKAISSNSLIVYIEADKDHQERLVEAAEKHPKPLYFRSEFLSESVALYLALFGGEYSSDIDPVNFVKWIFPRLMESRRPRYKKIATYGCTIASNEVAEVRKEADFIELIGSAIDKVTLNEMYDSRNCYEATN